MRLKFLACILLTGALFLSCNKKGNTNSTTDPCAGKTITITAVTTDAATGAANGSLTASATGSTGFTYSINNGAFASGNVFSNLTAGAYVVTVKDADGCTKQGSFTVNSADVCAGKNFVFTPAITGSDKCAPDGQITMSVTGGTGFQYKLDGGAYQSSASFTNISAGTHTFFAKDAAGCEKNTVVTVAEKPAGSLFIAVRAVIQARCVSCHNTSLANGGANFETDCGIVDKGSRIKVRAVDQGSMPPGGPQLSQADKDKITAWLNAGGKYSN